MQHVTRSRPRPQARTRRTLFSVSLSLLALLGCPDVKDSGAPTRCVKAYDKCTLATGVLGVCDTVECTGGEPPPCLVCRSQH